MEKYRKLPKEREPIGSDEIRITSLGKVMNYVSYAAKLLNGEEGGAAPLRRITVKATGNAIARAVTMTEVLKRRFKGLYQINKCGSTTITDVYEPTEEGLDKVTEDRVVSFLEIVLSLDPLDESDPGYQPPLDESLVKEKRPEEIARAAGFRERGGGYFRGGGMYRGGGYRGFSRGAYRGGFRGRGGRGRGGAAALHAGSGSSHAAAGNVAVNSGNNYEDESVSATGGVECSNGDFYEGAASNDIAGAGVSHFHGSGGGYRGRGGRGRGFRGGTRGGFRGGHQRAE